MDYKLYEKNSCIIPCMEIIMWNIYLFTLDEDVDKIEAHEVKSIVETLFQETTTMVAICTSMITSA